MWPDSAIALLLAVGCFLVSVCAGRWLRLVQGVHLTDVNRLLLTVAQGLLLLAILSGLDQRPLSRAALLAGSMALAWGLLLTLASNGQPTGRWWQWWRWDFATPPQ